MNVWLIHAGETLPIDGPVRLFRYGMLAQTLCAAGHHVTQWAPTFNHFTKQQRADKDTAVAVNGQYRIELLFGRGYQRHVGLRRILFHHQIARALARRVELLPRPDVIVAAIPTLELSAVATDFAARHGIAVVVDIRDLWPDVFLTVLPRAVRGLCRPLMRPLERKADQICQRATALVGVSRDYLAWGLRHARRPRSELDRVIPLGYRPTVLTSDERRQVEARWTARGIDPRRVLRCCYFGTLGNSSGVETLIAVARRLCHAGDADIQFIVCGKGPREKRLRSLASDLPNVRFLGWVTAPDIAVLSQWSDVGLSLYQGDVLQSLPNKPIEYLAGGLPVLSTLSGELAELLDAHGCGRTCDPGDVAAMAQTLRAWKADPQGRARMSRNALTLFRRQFDADEVYGAMVALLEEVVARHGVQQACPRPALFPLPPDRPDETIRRCA